jgi:peroxiredoxin
MSDIYTLPEDLPVPVDDGACDHLIGLRLPDLALPATDGSDVNISKHKGYLALYCYPMTGKPGIALPDGWDAIPGARGCTPQSCAFRDHYSELKQLGCEIVGMSTQSPAYQHEMATRLHLPFKILSDQEGAFTKALTLPTFVVEDMTLIKRHTLIIHDGVIKAVHYPIFPSHSDVTWVIDFLQSHPS